MEFSIIGGSAFIGSVPDFLSSVKSVSSANKTIIQAMDASKIAGEEHVRFAIKKAIRAIDNKSNVAKDAGIEIMRYASGKRQIGEAFSLGVHEGQMDLVFAVAGDKNPWKNPFLN
ncbi:MAG: KEOPS complex subunit Cgi121 [Methanolobus sp.]